MFPPHLNYLKDKDIFWFNPCWGFFGFWRRISEFQLEKKMNFQEAWKHRDMKKNKEKYALALAALCMQKDAPEKFGWWFTKTQQDPPDGIIGTIVSNDKSAGNIMSIREVEIVEHLSGSLIDTINKKLGNKKYEDNTILICLISPDKVKEFNFKNISTEIGKKNLPLSHIFVLFHGFKIPLKWNELSEEQKIKEMSKIGFVQLMPKYAFVNVSPYDCCKAFISGEEGAWLKFTGRGITKGFKNERLESPPILFE